MLHGGWRDTIWRVSALRCWQSSLGDDTCWEDKIHALCLLGGRWRVLVSGPHQWWTITSPEVFPFPQLSYPLTLEASSGWLWWSALIPHSRDLSDPNIIIRWVSLNNFDVVWGLNHFPNMSAPFGIAQRDKYFGAYGMGVEIDIIPECMVEWHRVHQIFHARRQHALGPLEKPCAASDAKGDSQQCKGCSL